MEFVQYGVAGLALALGLGLVRVVEKLVDRRRPDPESSDATAARAARQAVTAALEDVKRRLDDIQRDLREYGDRLTEHLREAAVLEYRLREVEKKYGDLERKLAAFEDGLHRGA